MSEEVRAKRLNSGIRRGEQVEFYCDGQPPGDFVIEDKSFFGVRYRADQDIIRKFNPLRDKITIFSESMICMGPCQVRTCESIVTELMLQKGIPAAHSE